jgi:hypothetical protein
MHGGSKLWGQEAGLVNPATYICSAHMIYCPYGTIRVCLVHHGSPLGVGLAQDTLSASGGFQFRPEYTSCALVTLPVCLQVHL